MARKDYTAVDLHTADGTLWPAEVPPLTAIEAMRAARRLWRWAEGSTFEGKVTLTTGNRYTWTYWPEGSNVIALRVNPMRGWRHLAHDLSHLFFRRANPGAKPHDKAHARFETRLVREILRRGWLDGKLRERDAGDPDGEDVPVAADPLRVKRETALARLDARLTAWNRKLQRAERAIAKIERQRRYYVKVLAAGADSGLS